MADYPPSQRLTTWKEIGQYIGRDSRTAKRYEVERQLPVRRMPNGAKSTVYAFKHELDRWLAGDEARPADATLQAPLPEPVVIEPVVIEPDQTLIPSPQHRPASDGPLYRSGRWPQRVAATAMGLGVLVLILVGAFWTASRAALAPMATREPVTDPGVQRLYTSGRYAWDQRTPDALRRAVDDFTQAIVLDPHYAPAYVGLADSYNLMPQYGAMPAAEAFPRAKAAAERAVQLSPNSAAAHRALAFVTFWWAHDLSLGMQEFQTAIRLDPNSAQTYHWYANALSEMREDSAALAAIKKALTLDPSSTAIRASEGSILTTQGKFSEARLVLNEVETVHPDYISAYDYMSVLLEAEGDDAGYLQQKEKSALLKKDLDTAHVIQAAQRALESGGHRAMLYELARGEEALALTGKQSPYQLAVTEIRLGGRSQAIRALEQSETAADPNAIGLARNSTFASLHGEPAFERLLVRIGSPH
jgi:tetratricopeptide (TPR) repeat protein